MVRILEGAPSGIGFPFDPMAGVASPNIWIRAYRLYDIASRPRIAERRGILLSRELADKATIGFAAVLGSL
jgi:hypothetical protein